jgi:hypothetical protein
VAVTEAVAGHGDDRVVILTGDLNDTSQAATSQLLLGPPGSNWAAKASTGPTRVTSPGCGTWPR